ncbi:hypothetical protein JCM10213_002728 [Rhodosporidiobolus nylandii]
MAGDDAFEKQAAAMAAPPPKKWVPSARSFVYAVLLFLLFGLAAGQVGIWSWVLQHHGNIKRVYDYPSREVMQTGNALFAIALVTLLVALGAYVLPLFFQAFLWFCIFVFNIVCGAILTVKIPFSASSSSTSNPNWARFSGEAGYWVGYEALAWTVMGLSLIMFVMVVADAAMAKQKRHYLLGHARSKAVRFRSVVVAKVAFLQDPLDRLRQAFHHRNLPLPVLPRLRLVKRGRRDAWASCNCADGISHHPHLHSPNASLHSTDTRSSHAPTEYSHPASTRSEEPHAAGFSFKSIRRAIVKAATSGAEPTHHGKDHKDGKDGKRPERPNMLGASSRGAGVRPKRSATTNQVPLAEEAAMRREMEGPHAQGSVASFGSAYGIAGPSRGGFIVQTHAKAVPTVATTTSDSTTLSDLPPLRLPPPVGPKSPLLSPVRPAMDRAVSVEVLPSSPTKDVYLGDSVLPPSTILGRLADVSKTDGLVNPLSFVPLLRLLAKSVSLFPFPPPALAASTLSDALAAYSAVSGLAAAARGVATSSPTPSPAQIYLSQSHHLVPTSPSPLRSVMLELMVACINASLESTGGMRESEKAIFWDEARRWAEEARVEVEDGLGGKRWVLPDTDREALVAVLSAMTRGGRDLSDVPGLVALLCTFVTEALPVPRPPSPLFDPNVATPFIRTLPHKPSPHASPLALLTALHKFSAPHIYTASTLMALRAALEVAKLREEQDIGGKDGVLDFLGAVVRFGEVTGGRAARRKAFLETSTSRVRDDLSDPDEILREVVSTVARLIGCEGLVSVVELKEGQTLRDVDTSPSSSAVKTSNLPALALDLMRDLIRSPANQATKSLRSTLIAPPPAAEGASRPRAPLLLLVGALRSLRKAMAEHTAELEASTEGSGGAAAAGLTAGESRWPSMLSLGLPFLWSSIRRVMLWESGPVDAEVLRLVEERLEACERAGVKAKETAAAVAAGGGGGAAAAPGMAAGASGSSLLKEMEDSMRKGVQYEEWEMAVEVLDKAKKHIGAWEQQNLRQWVLADDANESGPAHNGDYAGKPTDQDDSDDDLSRDDSHQFTQRPGVLTAFVSLLRKLIRAWRSGDEMFTGPSHSVFSLLVSLAPHLSEGYAQVVLEQCELGGLCLPSHPEWLDRTQEVVKAFYILPARTGSTRSLRRGVSSTVRQRVLQFITTLHGHLRLLPSPRRQLVDAVIIPLLETSLEGETDVQVAQAMVALVAEVGRDSLDVVDEAEEGPLGAFDRLRLLLVKMAKTSNRALHRQSFSSPATPKRVAGLASVSRAYNREGSPASSRILAPTLPTPVDPNEPPEISAVAAMGLISIFHLCLEHSSPPASEKAVVVYRDLLSLFSPAYLADTDAPSEPSPVSLRTRLLILQWLVRLRADASHRVHWIREVDITGPAKLLSRLAAVEENGDDPAAGAPLSARASEEGHGETRGRSSRQVSGQTTERSRSASRLRAQLENRSPSRTGSLRRPGVAPPVAASPILWTVPEKLPFDFGDAVASLGGKALASFDHNRMRNWTEEEDPGTGQMKVVEAEETLPPSQFMVVLPVSEYLRAVNSVLQHDQEWELVSYILCHLPEQLSNKHFACGPRCAQQIHSLRKILCDGLRAGDRGERVFPRTLPAGIKRAEIHAVAYHDLTALIAYRSLFTKQQQDDLVDTFMYGLGNPRDTAKPCIHALTIASFELRPSMTKHLAETVRHLQKIISSATLGVHILEFIAGVGQEPGLYANFTDVDFQTVFGIALKYIQAHNERLADDPAAFAAEEGIEYAFSQYVLLLAYYNIAIWFLALRLSERPKFVPFLTRRLVQANEGKSEVDEATEVMFDMLARYAHSNADPRPRPSEFDELVVGAPGAVLPPPKTWIVGHATVTIRKLQAPAWVEVTVRRASGVVKMLWEMQNISMTTSAPESDLIAAHLRHRGTQGLMQNVPSLVGSALASLPAHNPQPHIGSRARRASFAGTSCAVRPLEQAVEGNAVEDAINSAARDVAQLTLESGVLTVDPSFFVVQLSSFPHQSSAQKPILVPSEPALQRGVSMLDNIPIVDFHKVGVLYAGPGQTDEKEILANTHGSKAYVELISRLGQLVRLKGSRANNVYAGGLDQENDIDGKWTYVWDDDISQIVFHVATLMPTNLETDPQCTMKKRHIGNDFVKVIFNDSGGDFAFDTLPGDFNFVNIVIQPHTPAGNPWIGPGMSNNTEFFKVSMQRRPGMPEVGPLGTFKMVTGAQLPNLVRQLALHSNIFAQIFLASVGFETGRPAGTAGATHRIEYTSNWRKRLQQIKLLKKRIADAQAAQGGSVEAASQAPAEGAWAAPLDLEEAEAARLFTAWV